VRASVLGDIADSTQALLRPPYGTALAVTLILPSEEFYFYQITLFFTILSFTSHEYRPHLLSPTFSPTFLSFLSPLSIPALIPLLFPLHPLLISPILQSKFHSSGKMVALARLLMESGVVLAEEGPIGGLESFEELACEREAEERGAGAGGGAGRAKKVCTVRCFYYCYLLLPFPHIFL
jgi:hypothetical protein